jgi:hypothetical protein
MQIGTKEMAVRSFWRHQFKVKTSGFTGLFVPGFHVSIYNGFALAGVPSG